MCSRCWGAGCHARIPNPEADQGRGATEWHARARQSRAPACFLNGMAALRLAMPPAVSYRAIIPSPSPVPEGRPVIAQGFSPGFAGTNLLSSPGGATEACPRRRGAGCHARIPNPEVRLDRGATGCHAQARQSRAPACCSPGAMPKPDEVGRRHVGRHAGAIRKHRCTLILPLCAIMFAGCASTRVTPDIAYFPTPPSPARAVHIKSFNSLRDLVPARGSWTDAFRGRPVSPFVGTPAGIAYREDHLYICDTDLNTVHDWNLATGAAKRIGSKGNVILAKPVAVAVDDSANVYVADTQRAEVIAFDPTGQPIHRFKPPDREAYRPVAVAAQGSKLYVADIAAHVIDVYATDTSDHLETIGHAGSEPGKFYFPMGLATDDSGRIYVSDMMNARVQVFDDERNLVLNFGRPGNRYGDLGKPKHLTVGPDGVIFIADSEFLHVHLFDGQGRLLMLLGGPNPAAGPSAKPAGGRGPIPGATPMPLGLTIAKALPDSLASLVPPDFAANYFLFVTNTVGPKRINLFAIGQDL